MSRSSQRWLKEHFSDHYVQQAQQQGYRSRAAFKLIEIQQKDPIIKPGMIVVDLGAAPGGWSQILTKWVGQQGRVIALDILPMDPLPHVEWMQGDFSEYQTIELLQTYLNNQKVDVVVSDMAPNITGMDIVDQARSIHLCEQAFYFATQVLKPDGSFLVKAFQGADFDKFLQTLRQAFVKVSIRKPKASRARSRELYCLAKGLKKCTQSTGV